MDFLSPENLPILIAVFQDATAKFGIDALGRFMSLLQATVDGTPPRSTHPFQRPDFYFPGLRAQPWHARVEYTEATFLLEDHRDRIRGELDAVREQAKGFQPYEHERGDFYSGADWKVMYFKYGTARIEQNHALCPTTSAVLDRIPRLAQVAMFSALVPGARILPHCGTSNCRITIHLPLVIPDGCRIRVGDETRLWDREECLVFDDSFEHEVWNDSGATRFILLVDVWHPDLSDAEVWVLEQALSRVGHAAARTELARVLDERARAEGQMLP